MTDFVRVLESLPPRPLYALITALAALENIFPPVPADTAVALGAFLAGRGIMNAWVVFALTWSANVASGAAVYGLARRYGPAFFRGRVGRRLVSEAVLQRIAREYQRHGVWGIFLSRLLPIWRGVVMPFAGVSGVPAHRALLPLAAASALYYGTLTALITLLATNVESVLRWLSRINTVLGLLAAAAAAGLLVWGWVRARRKLVAPADPP
ncbi:MAG TPA: VTT domain-containing protein, partial [Gemmatimonadales bacterium]|nr:VTT domain-containing protein [Gemmatimonadales bacterium]